MTKDAKRIEGLVEGLIKGLKGKGHVTEEEMRDAWSEACGAAAARHSQPVSLKRTTLIVNVDGSGWLYELTINKKEITKKLTGALKGKKIKDIRFRIGELKK